MNYAIIEKPRLFNLHGISGTVQNEEYGKTGLGLMNQMWQTVKEANLENTGINHWVYLPDNRMFTGVELLNAANIPVPEQLESLEVKLHRYLEHVHIGPYEALPQKWSELKSMLRKLGEVIVSPSLEIYGHHCSDKSKLETTILISLEER
ncbi:MAG: GyrI-like domain-containing protein [Gemmatales bacterium]